MDKKIIIIIVAVIAIAAGAYFFMQQQHEPSTIDSMKNAAQNAVEDAKDLADK